LKCRAIVIASLRDGQTPIARIVQPKKNQEKSHEKCELRIENCGVRDKSIRSAPVPGAATWQTRLSLKDPRHIAIRPLLWPGTTTLRWLPLRHSEMR
jgi:hypothetical protein